MRIEKVLRLLRRLSPFVAGLLFIALLFRFVWRDTLFFTAPAFYALPLPLHAAGWLWLAALNWKTGPRKALLSARAISLGMVILMLGLWVAETKLLSRQLPPPASNGPRIFFWNIGHTHKVPDAVHELLDELSPDVAAFAEAENIRGDGERALESRHPGYEVHALPAGMLCMVKGKASLASSRGLPQSSVVQIVSARFARFEGEWRICLTDIGPMPPLPREPLLSEVYKTAGSHSRTIILGDFNTPLGSAAFDKWRDAFHHGFADCSAWHGPLETWAFGVPILAIDHIWMSPDLVPVRAQKGTRFGQDHSWIMVECGM
ncbi:MAG TPA: endonuclease/exonuclease/phosphatase family protein [Verrucomicrobiales bacterium]|nr:endonuclease/exonuclease/phosphatase family protein [Verrucomicrobiales bacterium]